MDRLPKDQAKLLEELIENDGNFLYLQEKLPDMPFDEAKRVHLLVQALATRGLVSCYHEEFKVERPSPEVDGYFDGFKCPVGASVTADGLAYREERRKDAFLWLCGSVVTAVLCGFFAWVFTVVLPT